MKNRKTALALVLFLIFAASAAAPLTAAPPPADMVQQGVRYKAKVGAPGFNSLYHLRAALTLIEMGQRDKLPYLLNQNYMFFFAFGLPVYNVRVLGEDPSIASFQFEPGGERVWGFTSDLIRY